MNVLERSIDLLLAAGAGATVAAFTDPRTGRRRRSAAWQKLDHSVHAATRGISVAAQDIQHRAHGVISMARGVATTRELGDDVVKARVQSRLGHACSYPHSIRVSCRDGIVELSGPILQREAEAILDVSRGTFGVRQVTDHLERHAVAGDVPGLQGIPRASRSRRGFLSPAARLLLGGSGTALAVAGLTRGGAGGFGIVFAGATLVIRSLANLPFAEIGGFGGRRPAIDVEKTITIHAAIDDVFDLLANPQKLARFMRHVEKVERIGENRWHWKVKGPGGMTFEWDGHFERCVPNELLVWKSAEDASVRHIGSTHLERTAANTTRVTIRLRYWPPAGLAGHDLARLLGDDPKREIDEDMLRLKSLFEDGKTTGPNGIVTLDEVRRSP